MRRWTPQRLPERLFRAEVAAVLAAPLSLAPRTVDDRKLRHRMDVMKPGNLRGCDIDSSPDCMCIRVVAWQPGGDR